MSKSVWFLLAIITALIIFSNACNLSSEPKPSSMVSTDNITDNFTDDDWSLLLEKYPNYDRENRVQRAQQTHSVPESDLTHIQFPEKWILKNNKSTSPYSIEITFPKTWITGPAELTDGDKYVTLRAPLTMFEMNTINETENEITVNMAVWCFEDLTMP